ncbi:hypothetical protein SDC9_78431 [bioreactor metagenome]|uniref:Uncharacterized protein n=1 Tax=bioreactor metagenome TaxID=1076179 RepID=A0A644Z102_9ZZZZ
MVVLSLKTKGNKIKVNAKAKPALTMTDTFQLPKIGAIEKIPVIRVNTNKKNPV